MVTKAFSTFRLIGFRINVAFAVFYSVLFFMALSSSISTQGDSVVWDVMNPRVIDNGLGINRVMLSNTVFGPCLIALLLLLKYGRCVAAAIAYVPLVLISWLPAIGLFGVDAIPLIGGSPIAASNLTLLWLASIPMILSGIEICVSLITCRSYSGKDS